MPLTASQPAVGPHTAGGPGDPFARAQVFRARHVGDWCAAALFLAIPIATGVDLWSRLGWRSESGRLLFLALALLGVGAAALYYVARIAVRVLVTPEGIAALRGPWRHEMRWREVARLRERTETLDRHPVRWLVAEAHDGRRLQVREDLVEDYARLRAAVYGAQQRWRALDAAGADQSGTHEPLYVAQQTPAPAGAHIVAALLAMTVALYLWALLPALRIPALALGAGGAALLVARLLGMLRRRSFAFDDDGVEAWSRFPTIRLEWRDVSRRDQIRPRARLLSRAAVWVGERLQALLAGHSNWVAGAPWPRRAPVVLLLRGGGRRLALPLHRMRDPDAVLARVERGLWLAQTAVGDALAHPDAPTRTPTTAARLPELPAPATPTSDEQPSGEQPGDKMPVALDQVEAPDSSAPAPAPPDSGDGERSPSGP